MAYMSWCFGQKSWSRCLVKINDRGHCLPITILAAVNPPTAAARRAQPGAARRRCRSLRCRTPRGRGGQVATAGARRPPGQAADRQWVQRFRWRPAGAAPGEDASRSRPILIDRRIIHQAPCYPGSSASGKRPCHSMVANASQRHLERARSSSGCGDCCGGRSAGCARARGCCHWNSRCLPG